MNDNADSVTVIGHATEVRRCNDFLTVHYTTTITIFNNYGQKTNMNDRLETNPNNW